MGKVTVYSNSRSTVCINIPHLHLKKEWTKKGAKISIDEEVLAEALYDAGVEYMFQNGILYIKEMDVKQRLGLEPEDATEPENVIVLTDAQKEEYMTKKQVWELKEILQKLSYEGKRDFCDYVVDTEVYDSKRAAIFKEVCDFNIPHAIENKKANEGETA